MYAYHLIIQGLNTWEGTNSLRFRFALQENGTSRPWKAPGGSDLLADLWVEFMGLDDRCEQKGKLMTTAEANCLVVVNLCCKVLSSRWKNHTTAGATRDEVCLSLAGESASILGGLRKVQNGKNKMMRSFGFRAFTSTTTTIAFSSSSSKAASLCLRSFRPQKADPHSTTVYPTQMH